MKFRSKLVGRGVALLVFALAGVLGTLYFAFDGTSGLKAQLESLAESAPPAGRIVFDSNRSGNFGIYSMRMDGTDVRKISDTDKHELNPAVSKDGSMIAFIRSKTAVRGVSGRLIVTDRYGDNPRIVGKNASTPAFSADGTRLYYFWKKGHIKYYDFTDGSTQHVFPTEETKFRAYRPAYVSPAPGGEYVAFVSNVGGRWYSHSLHVETQVVERLAHGCQPHWAYNGESVLFISGQSETADERMIIRYDVEEEKIETIHDGKPPWGHEYFPSLSPDGRYLLFAECPVTEHDHYTSNYQIFIRDLETGEVTRVQEDEFTNRWPRYQAPPSEDSKVQTALLQELPQ